MAFHTIDNGATFCILMRALLPGYCRMGMDMAGIAKWIRRSIVQPCFDQKNKETSSDEGEQERVFFEKARNFNFHKSEYNNLWKLLDGKFYCKKDVDFVHSFYYIIFGIDPGPNCHRMVCVPIKRIGPGFFIFFVLLVNEIPTAFGDAMNQIICSTDLIQ